MEAALSALVRSATRSISASRRADVAPQRGGLGIYARKALVGRGGKRGCKGIESPSFLRALPAELESTRTLAESLGGTSTTDSPEPANLPAR